MINENISTERRKSKSKYYLIVLGLVLLIGIASAYFYFSKDSSTNSSILIPSEQKSASLFGEIDLGTKLNLTKPDITQLCNINHRYNYYYEISKREGSEADLKVEVKGNKICVYSTLAQEKDYRGAVPFAVNAEVKPSITADLTKTSETGGKVYCYEADLKRDKLVKIGTATLELIEIEDAWLLDDKRNVIENITYELSSLDGITKIVKDSEYVRLKFNGNVLPENDIFIYIRNPTEGSIELYEKDGDKLLDSIDLTEGVYIEDGLYAYSLIPEISASEFDFLIKGEAEFDYIVDPTCQGNYVGQAGFNAGAYCNSSCSYVSGCNCYVLNQAGTGYLQCLTNTTNSDCSLTPTACTQPLPKPTNFPPWFTNVATNQSANLLDYINFTSQVWDDVLVSSVWFRDNFVGAGSGANYTYGKTDGSSTYYSITKTNFIGSYFTANTTGTINQVCVYFYKSLGTAPFRIYINLSTSYVSGGTAKVNVSLNSTTFVFETGGYVGLKCVNFTESLIAGGSYLFQVKTNSSLTNQVHGAYYNYDAYPNHAITITDTNTIYTAYDLRFNYTISTSSSGGSLTTRNTQYVNSIVKNVSYTTRMPSSNGTYKYEWCGNDTTGLSACYQYNQLVGSSTDGTAPAVSILFPLNGTIQTYKIDFIGNVTDAEGVGLIYLEQMNGTTWSNVTGCTNMPSSGLCSLDISNISLYPDMNWKFRLTGCNLRNNCSQSINYTYPFDNTYPTTISINITYPSGQSSVRNGQTIFIRLNATDTLSGINLTKINNIYLNGTNLNVSMIFEGGNKSAGGTSSWNMSVLVNAGTSFETTPMQVIDNATINNIFYTGKRIQVDNDAPTGTTRLDGNLYNGLSVYFFLNATDNYKLKNWNMSTNISGVVTNNYINGVFDLETNEEVGGIGSFVNGTHYYKFYWLDDSGNMNTTSWNEFIITNLQQTIINLINPAENTYTNQTTSYNFTFNYTGNAQDNCSLYLNDTLNYTWTSPSVDTNYGVIVPIINNTGWYIDCWKGINQSQSMPRSIFFDLDVPSITMSPANKTTIWDSFLITIGLNGTDNYIKSLTIYLYNSSMNLINSSYNLASDTFQATLSVPAYGIYWFKGVIEDMFGRTNETDLRQVSFNRSSLSIDFTNPTPSNGTTQSANSIYVNVTANDSANNISTFIDFDNSLVSWWRMDDVNASGTGVIDYMGRNNGTALGGAVQTDAGKMGKGFAFDGSGDYVGIANSIIPLANITGSISIWVKPNFLTTSGNNEKGIFYSSSSQGDGSGPLQFYFSASNKLVMGRSGGSGLAEWASLPEMQNTWTFLTLTWNYSNNNLIPTLYLNGVSQGNRSWTDGIDKSNYLQIGKYDRSGTWYYFNGTIDDVMIFNRSLSATEIQNLYANTSTKYLGVNFTGLVSGNHNFKAYAQDEAGNVNTTETRNVMIDSTAPIITIIYPANNSNFNASSISFNISASENLSWCGLSISGAVNNTMTLNASLRGANYTNSSIADGSYSFRVSCNDTLNNFGSSSVYNFSIDTIFPYVNIISPSNGSTWNNQTVNVTINSSGGNSIIPNFDNSLVSWWRMDDLNSSGGVVDYMGRNNGTALGGAVQTDAGKMGKGFSFDGVNDYVGISNQANFNLQTGNMTISAWINVKGSTTNNNNYIFTKDSCGENNIYSFTQLYSTKKLNTRFVNSSGSTFFTYSVSTLNDNIWYYVTFTKSGLNVSLYINGIFDNSSILNGNFATTSVSTSIATRGGSITNPAGCGGSFFNGTIDDVMIFNRSLSATEILGLYNATAPSYNHNFGSDGTHTAQAFVQDLAGNVNMNISTFTINTTISCVQNLTNTTKTSWTSGICSGNNLNQSRNWTEYDINNCGFVNITWFEYNITTPIYANTTFGSWNNITCLPTNFMNQSQNATNYNIFGCGSNTTVFNYRATETCDYCTPNMTYTAYGDWTDLGCATNDMNQTRNRTYYDSNTCGEVSNTTQFSYQLLTANITYTQYTAFQNQTCVGNQMNQSRTRIQYDSNARGCFNNITLTDTQLVNAIYVNTSWSSWDLGTCSGYNLNQSRNLTSYDIFGCAINITYFEYNYTTANLTNTTKTSWTTGVCDGNNLNQSRNWTQYDSNALGCYSNQTFLEYNYSTANVIYTAYTSWTDLTCIGQQRNQSRNRTQYDSFGLGCFINITTFQYQLVDDITCDTIAPAWTSLNNHTCYVNSSNCQHLITATDYYGTVNYFLNWTTKFNVNRTTGIIRNTSAIDIVAIYWFNASVNDSRGNTRYGIFWINVTALPVIPGGGNVTTCRYKKLGVYNLKLPWMKQTGCV